MIAAAAGFVAGAALGILFAPGKGEKTREDISNKTRKLFNDINEQGAEKFTELKEKFEGEVEKINEKIKKFANVS